MDESLKGRKRPSEIPSSSTNLIVKIRRGSSPVDQMFISVDEDACKINKGWVPTNHDYSFMPQNSYV